MDPAPLLVEAVAGGARRGRRDMSELTLRSKGKLVVSDGGVVEVASVR